jgi:hypothetical protein
MIHPVHKLTCLKSSPGVECILFPTGDNVPVLVPAPSYPHIQRLVDPRDIDVSIWIHFGKRRNVRCFQEYAYVYKEDTLGALNGSSIVFFHCHQVSL